MGIESGSGGGFELPRPVEGRIEGQVETSFTEIDIDQAQHVPLNDIAWPTARLSFAEQKGVTYTMRRLFGMSENLRLYVAQLEYKGKNGKRKTRNLSLTTSRSKPVFFTGTRNGFYAHDPLMNGRNDPFYVVGLQPDELQENMRSMSATYHELGHALICHTDADIQILKAAVSLRKKDLPNVKKAEAYGNDFIEALPYGFSKDKPVSTDRHTLFELASRKHDTDRSIRFFHERNAWAAGMKIARQNEYPTGFKDPQSYFDYARLCLESYAEYYRDRKFVAGWKKQ